MKKKLALQLQSIQMHNRFDLTSRIIKRLAEEHLIELKYIQPGKPTQNVFIKRFNNYEVLNVYSFRSLSEIRELTTILLEEYNNINPHSELGCLTPKQ